MKIIEARDGFIKFESKERFSLSSFVQINGSHKTYVAQVIRTKISGENLIIYAKILFLYDGTLKEYDNTLPEKEAEISEFTFNILSNSLNYNTPVIAGKITGEDIDIPVDKECFNKKMLICVDRIDSNNLIVSNLKRQFCPLGKVLIIDMLGVINAEKYVAGRDFSLPLNTEALSFLYADCLNDATQESKNMIKEIFRDLAEYSQSVPFVPFGTLKAIIDDMVDKSHIFKLLVLKNKLAKLETDGCFAKTPKEAENLKNILESDFAVIDLSKLDSVFQNRYLSCIYSIIEKQSTPPQVFLESSNTINKKNIKNALTNPNIATTFITHSKFKYINEIKNLFDNFIIEPSFSANEVFNIYNTFLNHMPNNTYLLVGEGTNYIPLVSSLTMITNVLNHKEQVIEGVSKQSIPEITDESSILNITEEENFSETTNDTKQGTTDRDIDSQEYNLAAEQPKDANNAAIEKKSDTLIEKLSEEVENQEIPPALNIFEDDDSDETDSETEISHEIKDAESQTNMQQGKSRELEPIQTSGDDAELLEVTESEPVAQNTLGEEIKELPDPVPTDNSSADLITEEQEEAAPQDSASLYSNDETLTENNSVMENLTEVEAGELSLEEKTSKLETLLDEPDNYVLEETANTSQEINLVPITEDNSDFEELAEFEPGEDSAETILVDLGDIEEEATSETEKDLDTQIVEDVDKVFTTIKEDDISDSDLDLIDELNEENNTDSLEELAVSDEFEELQPLNEDDDDSFLHPLEEVGNSTTEEDSGEILETRKTATPIVPVYDAEIPPEDMVSSDDIEQGDMVTHAKYGTGIVEKMIKYGTKTLYSINFDNIGRRLLDPALTEIKKS